MESTVETLELPCTLSVQGRDAGMVVARPGGIHITRSHDIFDLLFVCRGVLSVQEEERTFDVQAGQTLLLWPYRHHRGTRTYPRDLRYFWLHFTLTARPDAGAASLYVPQYTTVTRPSYLTELFLRYIGDRETMLSSPFSDSLLILLMLREISKRTETPTAPDCSASLAGRAYDYIRTNYRDPITPAQIASFLDCNPQYLSRVFSRTYHQTLTEFIHQTRLEYARVLLINSRLNVTEIARVCGFTDTRYFHRLFRRQQCMTAMEFRALYSRNFINAE